MSCLVNFATEVAWNGLCVGAHALFPRAILQKANLDTVLTGKSAERVSKAEPPWMDRLVDVLLSLLAKASGHLPSAPLRDAAEGLFRVFARHLTMTGDLQYSSRHFCGLRSMCCTG